MAGAAPWTMTMPRKTKVCFVGLEGSMGLHFGCLRSWPLCVVSPSETLEIVCRAVILDDYPLA